MREFDDPHIIQVMLARSILFNILYTLGLLGLNQWNIVLEPRQNIADPKYMKNGQISKSLITFVYLS